MPETIVLNNISDGRIILIRPRDPGTGAWLDVKAIIQYEVTDAGRNIVKQREMQPALRPAMQAQLNALFDLAVQSVREVEGLHEIGQPLQ